MSGKKKFKYDKKLGAHTKYFSRLGNDISIYTGINKMLILTNNIKASTFFQLTNNVKKIAK